MRLHFSFSYLAGILIGIMSSAIGLNISVITTGIKKYKSIIKKKKRKHDKILSLAKSKLSGIGILIFKALNDSNVSHNKVCLKNKVPKELDDFKKEMKNSNDN